MCRLKMNLVFVKGAVLTALEFKSSIYHHKKYSTDIGSVNFPTVLHLYDSFLTWRDEF